MPRIIWYSRIVDTTKNKLVLYVVKISQWTEIEYSFILNRDYLKIYFLICTGLISNDVKKISENIEKHDSDILQRFLIIY